MKKASAEPSIEILVMKSRPVATPVEAVTPECIFSEAAAEAGRAWKALLLLPGLVALACGPLPGFAQTANVSGPLIPPGPDMAMPALASRERSGALVGRPVPKQRAPWGLLGGSTAPHAKALGATGEGADSENNKASKSTAATETNCDTAFSIPVLYDEKTHTATFIVSHIGNVLHRPDDKIDENDKIVVKVRGPRSELLKLVIQRKSAFRDADTYRVLGEDAKMARFAATASECDEREVVLTDFAPGRGQVQLSLFDGTQTLKPLLDFDFRVHPLYRGAFSFGPVCSWLKDRTFGTVANGTERVITVTEQSPRVQYVVSYIHYWQPLDIEKQKKRFYQRIYPTLGLPLQNTLKNAFVGATCDVFRNLFYVNGGYHVGRVTVVDPQSGLGVGAVLPTGVSAVPTRTETQGDWYLGIGLDLRAAAKLLSAIGTGAVGGATP